MRKPLSCWNRWCAIHPLVDGNKRLGWLAVVVFYGLNGIALDAPDDEAYDLVIAMASGESDYRSAASRLAAWLRLTSPGSPGSGSGG